MINTDRISIYESYMVKIRRTIHQHPETGFEEFQTSRFIIDQLEKLGIEVTTGIGKTGVIGILKGDRPGGTVAIRADIDALNLTELSGETFKSRIDGKAHACGHDAHTSMALGTAKFFSENKDLVAGTIKFIFQPAEEGPYPGGAVLFTESGLIDDVEAIFALHVDPSQKTGSVTIPRYAAMASADFFSLKLIGKGGHGAAPHDAVDPIYMSSQVIGAFQGIVSRKIDPVRPVVLSVCTIQGGSSYNIIPESVHMTGTIRAMDAETRAFLLKEIDDTLKGITSLCHGTYKFELVEGYPPMHNDPGMSRFAKEICEELLGPGQVTYPDNPRMTSEDFAHFLNRIPGAFIWLGCQSPDTETAPHGLHSPYFKLDEKALVKGSTILSNLIMTFLSRRK